MAVSEYLPTMLAANSYCPLRLAVMEYDQPDQGAEYAPLKLQVQEYMR